MKPKQQPFRLADYLYRYGLPVCRNGHDYTRLDDVYIAIGHNTRKKSTGKASPAATVYKPFIHCAGSLDLRTVAESKLGIDCDLVRITHLSDGGTVWPKQDGNTPETSEI